MSGGATVDMKREGWMDAGEILKREKSGWLTGWKYGAVKGYHLKRTFKF